MKIRKVLEYINMLFLNVGRISDVINGIRSFLSCSIYNGLSHRLYRGDRKESG